MYKYRFSKRFTVFVIFLLILVAAGPIIKFFEKDLDLVFYIMVFTLCYMIWVVFQGLKCEIIIDDEKITKTGIKFYVKGKTIYWKDMDQIVLDHIMGKEAKTRQLVALIPIDSSFSNRLVVTGYWDQYEDLVSNILKRLPDTCKVDPDIQRYVFDYKPKNLFVKWTIILGVMIFIFFLVMVFAYFL